MITYEYQCSRCHTRLEHAQRITDAPLVECPRAECRGVLVRLVSRSGGFVLQGGGWAKDGY